MDDLKLYAKSEEKTNMLVRSVHMFSTNIGMEFGIKFGILTMKRSKIVNIEGKKLPHGDVMKHVGQEGLPIFRYSREIVSCHCCLCLVWCHCLSFLRMKDNGTIPNTNMRSEKCAYV